ncbi:aldose 1-epimerase family protein [Microbacterium sp. STN6]|uniref:aldose 1-epimerase family protein n=1 Tax=Microbacterium sp. STN6 TaxID=2995588 RepID=UPI002260F0C2|nr:aldose 1-epimerase family protein [Microbacterium sp. STN6]MCX7523366.1 aldose 1-epimerase family protein [Microbacterium sp. STN6]
MRAPTGEQFELTRQTPAGEARAVITEVAASLRQFTLGGVDLTEPYPQNATPPSGVGIVLVPWPNRVKDGRWQLNGQTQQLDLTEPDRDNAIHGLLRYSPYTAGERSASAVTLHATVFPQAGYPFLLDTSVTYEIVDDGLTVTHTITNAGTEAAPVAVGTHPYFKIGDVPTADLTITVRADTHFEVDDRLNIVGEHPVEGTKYDLRGGKRVGDLTLDDGWADVTITDGRGEQTLTAPDGRTVSMWSDEHFGYVQVFTSRSLPTLADGEVAIAIEPMTAPTNALNTGRSLTWLEPGDTWTVRWGMRHTGF